MKLKMCAWWACCAAVAGAATSMPMIVSHRGESKDAPENTMAAFRLAVERGVDGMECDVYATADGVPVIMHDESMSRTTGVATNITACTAAFVTETGAAAFGSWPSSAYANEKVPTLAQYLDLLNSNATTKAVIELKSDANNLIEHIAEAVAAQPAATADRVVFISFSSSLVSAVRTNATLKDYPAWLLVGACPADPASLIASAQACHATGVDVSSGFDAACVAAVKSAGLAFVTWTVDNVDTAAAQTFMGVDGITTNCGRKLMDEMPAKIAALDAEAAACPAPPRTKIPGPDGIVDFEALDAYVTDGLLAFYDGIQNAGDGQPHAAAPAKWTDRVAGATASFPRTGSLSGVWHDTCYTFNTDYAQLDVALPELGTNFTVQLVTDINCSAQPTNHYPNIFAAPNDFCAFLNNKDKTTTTSDVVFKTEPYSGTDWQSGRPSLSKWGGQYLTLMFTPDYWRCVFQSVSRSGGLVRAEPKSGSSDSVASQRWTWGGSAFGAADRYLLGSYYGVRIYNRALTDEELAINREVDEARYRGTPVVTNVLVGVSMEGPSGVEPPQAYTVRGSHTFTATNVVVDGCTWAPDGYALERWNAQSKSWTDRTTHAGASYTHTVGDTQPAVRLVWKWRLVSGLRRLDTRAYVQDGLLLHFDGADNAGFGVHDAQATTWKNLGRAPTDAVFHPGSADESHWLSNGYWFNGSYADVVTAVDPGLRFTIQVVCNVLTAENPNPDGANWPTYFGSPNDQCNLYTGDAGSTLNFKTDAITGASNENGTRANLGGWSGRFITACIDYNGAMTTQTATPGTWKRATFKSAIGARKWCWGSSSGGADVRYIRGAIHSVRLYDHVLNADELALNRRIDEARFFPAAPKGAFVIASNLRGAAGDQPNGEYDAAGTLTLTAPATCTTPDRDFALRGYRVETWNAGSNIWNVASEGTTGSVTLTLGATPTRLTWLWTPTRGLKSGYTIDDYVQDGLTAQYDGICNWGRELPHSQTIKNWQDTSGSENTMSFTSKNNPSASAWDSNAYAFNVDSYAQMGKAVAFGDAFTIEQAMTVKTSEQTQSYPNYVATKGDFGIFTRGTGATLEWKDDEWRGSNNDRPKQSSWKGLYLTAMYTPTNAALFQGTSYANIKARATDKTGIPAYKWSVGAAYGGSAESRYMKGLIHATRFYNRTLTEAELAQNRRVDEYRFRGAGLTVTNVVVAAGRHADVQGVEPTGVYEVEGAWIFSAAVVTRMNDQGKTVEYTPTGYTLETFANGAWSTPVAFTGTNYLHATASSPAPVRLTWKWSASDSGTLVILR